MIEQSIWDVNWPVISQEDKVAFESRSRLLDTPMERVTGDRYSSVSRLSLQNDYYVKSFSGYGEKLKQLLGISRFHRELRNLRYFSQIGLPTPDIAASGYESRLGFLRSGTLVTVAVRKSVTLEHLLENGKFYGRGTIATKRVLDQLAQALKLLHQCGFYHRDMKTRNILVKDFGEHCELVFFDCPSGYHPPRLIKRSWVMRDLAYLERGLRGYMRKVDILYLYKAYRGSKRLSERDKVLARKVLSYYDTRRMTPKRQRREERRAARLQKRP